MTRRVLGKKKVKDGKAKIPLTVEDPDYSNGEYPLNIKYLENNYYEGSDAFGKLLHMFKTFIHCPTIYVYRGIDEYALLTCNLYSNLNLLNEGTGNFTVENVALEDTSKVKNGCAKYEYSIKRFENTNDSYFPYGFIYNGVNENYREPVRYDNARVVFVELGKNLIPVSIKTYPVMGAKGETVELVCRVYKTINGGAIDAPKDIPDNGYLKWYVNGRYVGQTGFYESGYAFLDYKIIEDVGVYEYSVEYVPTSTKYYNSGFGANTLCVLPGIPTRITATADMPTGQLGQYCTFTLELSRIDCISGLRLYIDDQLVSLIGATSTNNYTLEVTGQKVDIKFFIPEEVSPSKRWAIEGTHMVFWEYDDTCTGVTHYQPLGILLIMFPSIIDFDYIGRNTSSPYDTIIFNEKTGIPIVTPEILGHVYNENYPDKELNDGNLTLDIEKLVTHMTQQVTVEHVAPTVNEANYEVDDYAVITSLLYSNKDLSISSRLLQFISTNPEGTTSKVGKTTSTNGATSKTLLNMAGTWKLQTVYAGNKYEYDSSIVTKSINVVKKDTNLTISYTPSTVYVDDTVTYTVILKCVDTVLQGIQVVLQLDDDNNVTKTTDSNGKVTITKKYTVSQKSTLKANSLETYKYKPSTASQTITVKKLSTTLSAIDQSGIVTDTITVPITIFDQNNKKPNCGTINIKEGSTIIKTLNVATDTLSFDRVFTQAGTKTYTLEYKDTNNRYESSTSTVKVTARTLNTTLSAVDQSGRVGDTLTVPITILDERNKKPTIGTITIKDGNTTIKTLNVATDTLSFDRVFSEAGTKTYTIEYKDTSNKYSASSTTVNVTARALNTTINILSYTINSNTSSTIPTNYAFTAETSSYFQIDYNITDEDNNIISTGQTSITAPSGVEIIETDKYVGTNKKNSFNIPELTCGNKTLTINYAGTNVYKSSTRDLTVNPTSVDTVITLPTSAVYMKDMGDTSSDDFTVSIETKYGKPVRSSNGKLILYIQRKTSTSEITSKYKVWESTIGSNSTNTWTLNAYDDLNWTSIIADMKKQNKLIYTEYTLSAEYVNSGNNCYNNSSIEAKIGNMIAQCTSPRINIQLSAIAPIYRDDGITTGTTQSMTITDTTPRDDYVFNMYRYSKFKLEAVVRDKQNNIVGGINTDFGFINYDKDVIDYDDEDNEIGRTPAGEEITSSDIIITPTNAVTTYTGGVTVDYTRPNNDVMIAQDNLYAVFRFGVYSELFPTQKEYKIKLIDILKEVNITLPTGSVNVYDSGKSDSENFSISVKDSNGNSVLSGTLKVYLQSVKYSDLDPIEVWSTNVTSSTNSWTGNAYSLFSYTSLFNTMKNLNYLIFSGYQIVAKYIPTNPQYATMNKTANASLQYKCKSPSIELIGISSFKEDKSHRFDINEEHNWLINTSGTGVIQGGTTPLCDSFKVEPISSGALNRTLYLGDYNEVQFRVLDTNGNRIGGIQFFQWFTAESTTYRIYKTDENGEYVYDSNGEKILATDEYYEYPDGVPLTDAPLDPCYPKYPVPIAKFNRNPDLNKTTYTEDTMFDWTFGNSTGNTDDLKFTIVFDQYLSNIFPDISNKRDNPYRYVFSRVATSPVVYTATFSIILDLIIHSSH